MANIDARGELKVQAKAKLFNLALQAYEDAVIEGKTSERVAAANCILELLGKKPKAPTAAAQFNFNIPPEHLSKIFGEGLPKLTGAVEAEYRQLEAPKEEEENASESA